MLKKKEVPVGQGWSCFKRVLVCLCVYVYGFARSLRKPALQKQGLEKREGS